MDGWVRWVKVQVGETPGPPISLGAIGAAVLGLCLSLFVRPRRVDQDLSGRMASVWWRSAAWTADARAGLSDDVAELANQLEA